MNRKRGKRRSRRPANFTSMVLVSFVVVMIVAVIFVKNKELRAKEEAYQKKEEYLLAQIEAQNERSEEIDEYGKYMQTKQYVEDIAKSRLGLVYPDEIIFEADN